jgi:hypothetical protein
MLAANNLSDVASKPTALVNIGGVPLAGGTMTGLLILNADPASLLGAATKQYSDLNVKKSGDTMAGPLALPGNPASALQATPKQYVDAQPVVHYDVAQSLTTTQLVQARANIYAAPFDALAYNGMQANGSLDVDQENAGASVPLGTGSVTKYVLDVGKCLKTGTSAIAVQQVASIFPGYANELKLTVTTAQASIGSDNIYFQFSIEGWRFNKAMWGTTSAQPVTVGFWIKSTVGGTLALSISDAVSINVFASPSVSAGVAQFVTATFPAQTSWGGSGSNGIGASFNIYAASSGAINIVSSTLNTLEITGLIILPGIELPSASRAPFIMRPYDQELRLCRRYIEIASINSLQVPAASYMTVPYPYKVTKRGTPIMTEITPATLTNMSSAVINGSSVDAVYVQVIATAAGGFLTGWVIKADARL